MLRFNGVDMPEPKADGGILIKPEKIWSKNARRSSNNGYFVGDLIAIKDTISINWPPLSGSETALINSYLKLPELSVTYIDPDTNAIATKLFYSGTPSYPVYSYVDGVNTYTGVTVDIIKK